MNRLGEFPVGTRVTVNYGRWAGRVGTVVGNHWNPGGMVQQGQSYPVVKLDPRGRAIARTVRVVAVTPLSSSARNIGSAPAR